MVEIVQKRRLMDAVAAVRLAQKRREREVSLAQLKELAAQAQPARNIAHTLASQERPVQIIAEVKTASATFVSLGQVPALARTYTAAVASAISVVTQVGGYAGSIKQLDAVAKAVDAPIIVNDLPVTTYQIHEARAHGADGITFTMQAQSEIALESLIERTHQLGMTSMVQVRSRREALQAMALGAQMISVDARDYVTGQIDPTLFAQIADVLGNRVIRVAAGGVRGPHDVMQYAKDGANVVVVGQAAILATDIQQFVSNLVSAGSHPALHKLTREKNL